MSLKWLSVWACLLAPLAVSAAALAQTAGPPPAGSPIPGSPATVIDGDTIRIGQVRYRLYGIDAPEKSQKCRKNGADWACGLAATAYLKQLVGHRAVACESRGQDRYNRVVAICRTGETDLNRAMVRAGLAWAYTAYSRFYLPDQQEAKRRKAGIWAPGTEAEPAWAWRREQREKRTRIRG